MAGIVQAAKWMKEGKKVKRPNDGEFVYEMDHASCLSEAGVDSCVIAIADLLADDWEIAQ